MWKFPSTLQTLSCFSIIRWGMKNKTTADKKSTKKKQTASLISCRPVQKPPSPYTQCNLSSSCCELHRFLVLMLLLCARRKVLWSRTDLYQRMQMLDVGAGAGGAPPPAPQTVTLADREWNESSDLYWTNHSSFLLQHEWMDCVMMKIHDVMSCRRFVNGNIINVNGL